MGEKMFPQEAFKYGFVTRIYETSQLDTTIWPKIKEYSQLPAESLQISKALMRMHEKKHLHDALHQECEELYRRFYSEEFINAIIQFSNKKSKM